MSRSNITKVAALTSFVVLFAPFIASASHTVEAQIGIVGGIISLLIPIVIALSLLYFFWGLAKFILHADDETEREKGKKIMLWGIIILFVILSIWGIIGVFQDTFVGSAPAPLSPQAPI